MEALDSSTDGSDAFFADPIVTFYIGDRKLFRIHRRLVTNSSMSFQKKINQANGDCAKIEISDIHPNIFRMYGEWLYTGDIGVRPLSDYLQAFLFAEKHVIWLFKQICHGRIHAQLSEPKLPNVDFVVELYSHGIAAQELQDIAVTTITRHIHQRLLPETADPSSWLSSIRQKCPSFCMDYAECLTHMVSSPTPESAVDSDESDYETDPTLQDSSKTDSKRAVGSSSKSMGYRKRTAKLINTETDDEPYFTLPARKKAKYGSGSITESVTESEFGIKKE